MTSHGLAMRRSALGVRASSSGTALGAAGKRQYRLLPGQSTSRPPLRAAVRGEAGEGQKADD